MDSRELHDSSAFETLVRDWQQPVARMLGRLVGRGEHVPDLCQEVFLRVFHALPKYREQGAFASWLYRIVLNVACDAGRRRGRELASLDNHEPVARDVPADRKCEEREVVDALGRAIAELSEPLRVVLVLRHYEGLSFEEIARLTGTPASTLKSRFAVALQRLRERLQELGWDPEEVA